MKRLFTFTFCLLPFALFSQLPDCDIFLLDIKDSAGNSTFKNPVNITNRKGYDNQPAFSPDGKYIFYSSQRDSGGSTDIYKYDLKTKQVSQFTKTPMSEYSPTFMIDGKNISVVMVEKDSAQRLWKFTLSGGEPTCLMKNVDSIGYHCWINKDSVAIFVLTKPSFTLQLVSVNSLRWNTDPAPLVGQKRKILVDSAGRCMRMKDGALWLTTKWGRFNNVYEYVLISQTLYLKGRIESEDYCFYKKEIWSCSENTIVSGYMSSKTGAIEVANLESFGIFKPTRITLSPDGKKLAVVSNK